MAKKASDFRYNTGETKVPWAAVGENYNAEDLMAIVRFLMKGEGEEYDAAIKAVEEKVYALDKVSEPPAKLSLDAEVAKAEEMCDEFLNTEGCLFVTNCTGGFEIACKYANLKPGDEVIVPGYTFIASISTIAMMNAVPVLAEIDDSLTIDPTKIETELGWTPKHNFDTGIQETIKWYLENQDWMDQVTSGDYLKYYENMYSGR